MLRGMAWRVHEQTRQVQREGKAAIGHIEIELGDMSVLHTLAAPPPDLP